MRRLLLLLVVSVVSGCGLVETKPATVERREAVQVMNVMALGTPRALGRALDVQRDPAVASNGTEQLVAWMDGRNGRYRRTDIYGARVRNGVVLDPLGVPLLSDVADEAEPSLSYGSNQWWLTEQRLGEVVAVRFTEDLLGATEAYRHTGSHARIAANATGALIVYRDIGRPFGALLGVDGGLLPLADGGFEVQLRPGATYPGGLGVAWSDFHQAYFALVPGYAPGLTLTRVDVPLDGGRATVGPPLLLQNEVFSNDTYATSSADLAFGPGGELGMAWRSDSRAWVLALATVPTSPLDAGVLVSSSVTGSPSITWTGSRFRVAWSTTASTLVRDLELDGGLSIVDTLPAMGSSTACTSCPPVRLLGTQRVVTLGPSGELSHDLEVSTQPEGQSATPATLLTRSGSTSHAPTAGWAADAGQGLLAWSEPDSSQQPGWHDLRTRLFVPPNSFLSPQAVSTSSLARDDSAPRVHWALGRWWLGFAGATDTLFATALVSQSTNGLSFSASSLSQGSNSPPSFAGGWVASSNQNEVEFRRLLDDGGIDSAFLRTGYSSASYPSVAVDALDRPLAVSVTRPGAGESARVDFVGAGPTSYGVLTTNAGFPGEPRSARLATDGSRFVAVYSQTAGPLMTLRWRFLDLAADGGLSLGSSAEFARAPIIETPQLVFGANQYLVTWSERPNAWSRATLRVRTLRPDVDAGAEVPLELPGLADDIAGRLTVLEGRSEAVLTWVRLNSADAGMPVAMAGLITLGAGLGTTCSTSASCASGFCANGRCCDVACNEGCGSCTSFGVCVPSPAFAACSLQNECVEATMACDGTSLVCPTIARSDGVSCASDAGVCRAGQCEPIDAGTPDAGVDAGVVDAGEADAGVVDAGAGEVDAGAPDAGVADAGTPDAGEEVDAGLTLDGGSDAPDAGAGVSHYSWNQGCGCTSLDWPLAVLAMLLATRRRARTRTLGATLGLLLALAPATSFAQTSPKKLKLSFPGVSAGSGAKAEDATALSEFLQSQLVARDVYSVTGASDLTAMLGAERQRALLGCGETASSCMAEIAGALDADRLLTGSLSRLGDTWVLTISLNDLRKGTPLFRSSRRFTGGLDRSLDAVDPLLDEILAKDTTAFEAAGRVAQPSSPGSKHQWTVGVRAEGDVVGLAAGQPAVAPALIATWGYSMFGAALTVVPMVTPGVRLEARLHLFETSPVRPLLALGGTLFGAAFAPRGALGATADVGPVRFSLDVGVEYFVSGPTRFAPLSVLVALGGGVRF